MADFIFDGDARLLIEPAGTGDLTQADAGDLYSAWKRWVLSGEGAKFPPAFFDEGGTPTAPGRATGVTFVLINGWKVQPENRDHTLNINGTLDSDDGIVGAPPPSASAGVTVRSAAAAQIRESGVSGLTQTEASDLSLLRKHVTNTKRTDPQNGEMQLLDDDDQTVLLTWTIWQDFQGTIPYQGRGVERRDKAT